jgi:hypothetical protein
MNVNRKGFDWRRFLSLESYAALFVTANLFVQLHLHGPSGREFVEAGETFVAVSGLALLLVLRTRKNGPLLYWAVTVGFLLMALGMGAFTLLALLKHHDSETQLVGWMLLAVIPVPWVFAMAGNLILERKVRGSDLSLDSQEDILRLARRFSNIILVFVCAIICGFTRILSFYLK